MTFYSVLFDQDNEGGVAEVPDGWSLPCLTSEPLAATWTIPSFPLEGAFVDLQACTEGIKLFSPRMRHLIDETKAPIDRLEWLPVCLAQRGETREYGILHFLDALDVIDRAQSVLNRFTQEVIKPHLSIAAVGEHRVFTYKNRLANTVLIATPVYHALKGSSGCAFSKVRAS
jgi:hypothetical protein